MTRSEDFDFVRDGTSILNVINDVIGNPQAFVPLHEPEFSPSSWDMVKDC